MSPANANIWPSSPIDVPTETKKLITGFFEVADSTDYANSGQIFADHFFTEDGLFKTHETCVFKGREAIAASRKNNSPLVTTRSHKLDKVYAANSPATDLLVLGSFTTGLKDGTEVSMDFSARFVVQEGRFSLVRVWTDPTEMVEAFKRVQAVEDEAGGKGE